MSDYEKLWQSWQSGQISALQMARHLEDDVFVAWLKKRDLFSPYLRSLAKPIDK